MIRFCNSEYKLEFGREVPFLFLSFSLSEFLLLSKKGVLGARTTIAASKILVLELCKVDIVHIVSCLSQHQW